MPPIISSFALAYSNYLDIVINNYDSCLLIQVLKYIFLSCIVHMLFMSRITKFSMTSLVSQPGSKGK